MFRAAARQVIREPVAARVSCGGIDGEDVGERGKVGHCSVVRAMRARIGHIVQRQIELARRRFQALRAATELRATQLGHEQLQVFDLDQTGVKQVLEQYRIIG